MQILCCLVYIEKHSAINFQKSSQFKVHGRRTDLKTLLSKQGRHVLKYFLGLTKCIVSPASDYVPNTLNTRAPDKPKSGGENRTFLLSPHHMSEPPRRESARGDGKQFQFSPRRPQRDPTTHVLWRNKKKIKRSHSQIPECLELWLFFKNHLLLKRMIIELIWKQCWRNKGDKTYIILKFYQMYCLPCYVSKPQILHAQYPGPKQAKLWGWISRFFLLHNICHKHTAESRPEETRDSSNSPRGDPHEIQYWQIHPKISAYLEL